MWPLGVPGKFVAFGKIEWKAKFCPCVKFFLVTPESPVTL